MILAIQSNPDVQPHRQIDEDASPFPNPRPTRALAPPWGAPSPVGRKTNAYDGFGRL